MDADPEKNVFQMFWQNSLNLRFSRTYIHIHILRKGKKPVIWLTKDGTIAKYCMQHLSGVKGFIYVSHMIWDYLVWFDVQKIRLGDYFLEEQWTDLNRCQSMSVPIMPSPDAGFWSKYVNEFLVSWSKRQNLERGKKLVHGSVTAQTPSPLGISALL